MNRMKTAEAARVAGKKGFSLISDAKFRELYAALLQCNMLDERLASRRGYERWAGREAATAGVAACLCSGDTVTPTPRGTLAGYLQHGTLTGITAPAAPDSHFAAAAGDALRHKLEKQSHIAVVYTQCGEPGRMREIFSLAAKLALPLLYVLQGSAPSPAICGSIPVMRVDGSDTVAVYRVAYESITRARDGGGPTIMECAAWPVSNEPDPLAKLELYLANKKLFRKDWKKRLEQRYSKAVNDAVKAAAPR